MFPLGARPPLKSCNRMSNTHRVGGRFAREKRPYDSVASICGDGEVHMIERDSGSSIGLDFDGDSNYACIIA